MSCSMDLASVLSLGNTKDAARDGVRGVQGPELLGWVSSTSEQAAFCAWLCISLDSNCTQHTRPTQEGLPPACPPRHPWVTLHRFTISLRGLTLKQSRSLQKHFPSGRFLSYFGPLLTPHTDPVNIQGVSKLLAHGPALPRPEHAAPMPTDAKYGNGYTKLGKWIWEFALDAYCPRVPPPKRDRPRPLRFKEGRPPPHPGLPAPQGQLLFKGASARTVDATPS